MFTWMSSLINAQDGCLQMVAQRASMGRTQQEHLAQQVAQCSMMPSMTDQVTCLRAQLAHRDAQLEQVRAERDNHFVQEEEVLAHMRLLSSEAKDWKSRVVTEAEECYVVIVLKLHNKLPKHKSPWINITRLNGNKQKQTLQLYVNPTAPKCSLSPSRCMRRMRNIKSFMMHKRDSRAEIHELHTELLNMKEKSEMKSRLAANIRRVDQPVPSRTVESEPENVLDTLSLQVEARDGSYLRS